MIMIELIQIIIYQVIIQMDAKHIVKLSELQL